ncbi:MAG TPA: glycosyltransferase [Candidatus Methylomirabilis sp.]|nr:glycosyltransferase [Candidatus Methylomirabilis sp.]
MPEVSIILNIFNGAATLGEALQSALDQTFTDWELIAWDDRSSDDSAAIVASFHDPRIRYFLAPDSMSLGQARDAAIQKTHGEWLAFLDQDDIWLPRKLELQLALADSPAVGMVYGRTLAFFPDGGQRDHDYFHEFESLPEGDVLPELLGRGCFVAMSSALLRRSAVQEAGSIPDFVRVTPDYFLYLSVCSRYATRAIQEVVCRYRIHAENMTVRYRRETQAETLLLVDAWRSHLSEAAYVSRRTHISTALALEELRTPGGAARGLQRLLRDGSLSYLAGRPFVRLFRRVRRLVARPYWKTHTG